MGLFDAISGKPAARATRGNEKQLWNNLTEGFGFLDIGREAGLGHLQQGMDQGQQYLGQAGAAFAPLSALGQKYGGATSMLLDAQGVNGPEGVARAQGAFQTGPGYQFAMQQGGEALNRQLGAAGRPGLASGNAMQEAVKFGQGMANQQYGDWLKNFQAFINPELAATSGAAGGQAAALGQQANLAMGGETAISNLWQQDAANRVNLNNMTTQGLTQNATQGANAQMAASGNALNLGLNALKLGAGAFGGGGLFSAGGIFGK